MTQNQVRILVALDTLAQRAATSIREILSFVRDQGTEDDDALRREVVQLWDNGYVCRSKRDEYYALTPRGQRALEDSRLDRAAGQAGRV